MKSNTLSFILLFLVLLKISSCFGPSNSIEKLEVVTHSQFDEFVKKTGYVTEAEKFGWSIVQHDVVNFSRVDGANWRKPDGHHSPNSEDLPVTQVSFNDAQAYCKWSGSRLPTYEEYWQHTNNDKRKVIANHYGEIWPGNKVNILGNVWEITSTENKGTIRLAGGSYLCSISTCYGTKKERELYVDKLTANIHIGFAVLKKDNQRKYLAIRF